MRKGTWFRLLMVGLLAAPLALTGCGSDGSDGAPGAQGPAGPPGPPGTGVLPDDPTEPRQPAPVATTASESCDVCHGPTAQLLPMNRFHDVAALGPVLTPPAPVPAFPNTTAFVSTITAVDFTPVGTVVQPLVTFSVSQNGAPLTTLADNATNRGRLAFGIAKRVAGTGGSRDEWRSYINRRATGATTVGGAPFTPAIPGTVSQATTASGNTGGTLTHTGAGVYTFRFNQDLATATTFPESTAGAGDAGPLVNYDPAAFHRVGIQFTPSAPIGTDVRFNTWLDVVPNGGTPVVSRNLATTNSCLECHTRAIVQPRWGFHGSGARWDVEFCVLCHNPTSVDPESGETVDLAVMVHKIHRGQNLPSVAAGGSYTIWGNNNSEHDYSHVGYPQDIRNCEKCHTAADAATPDGNNWMTRPSRQACGSCHDDVNFATGANHGGRTPGSPVGGAQASDANCTVCHPATGAGLGQSVDGAHTTLAAIGTANYQFNVVSAANTAPGQTPSVTFSVTNPATGTPINILTDPAFTQTATGASRLAVIIGWMTGEVGQGVPVVDWTNEGSGNNVGQPVSINPLAAGVATANADGSFTVTSPVAVPLNAQGTGIAALEGHPALADGTRIPVPNAFLYFPVTDDVAVPRREVVTAPTQPLKCNNCHDHLSIHGANRTDSIQVCVICHNPNATDILRRPDLARGIDGKFEETIDFKNMIHAIHASGVAHGGGGSPRTTPVVVYGFGGTAHDFGHVTYPGNMRRCTQCHEGTTWQLPVEPGVLATTVNSGADLADPADDGNITKTAGVCSACHDPAPIRAHMVGQGASFNVRQSNILE